MGDGIDESVCAFLRGSEGYGGRGKGYRGRGAAVTGDGQRSSLVFARCGDGDGNGVVGTGCVTRSNNACIRPAVIDGESGVVGCSTAQHRILQGIGEGVSAFLRGSEGIYYLTIYHLVI